MYYGCRFTEAEEYKEKLERGKIDKEYLQELSNELGPRREMYVFLKQSMEKLQTLSYFKNYRSKYAALLVDIQERVKSFNPDKVNNQEFERNVGSAHEIMEERGRLVEKQVNAVFKAQTAQNRGKRMFKILMDKFKQYVK